jgi:chromosome segregation ATPase
MHMVNSAGILNKNGMNRSELSKAEARLQELEAKLQHIRSILNERKAERLALETKPQILSATGDINKLMTLKSRSIALDKSIAELMASESECAERIESARRYLYTLYVRLEKLRQEAANLTASLSSNRLPQEALPEIQTSLRRVKVQIEAIAGAE